MESRRVDLVKFVPTLDFGNFVNAKRAPRRESHQSCTAFLEPSAGEADRRHGSSEGLAKVRRNGNRGIARFATGSENRPGRLVSCKCFVAIFGCQR